MSARRDVWEAFADQFVGREPRALIPRAALCALDAGLSRSAAYDVWRFEVTRTVMINNEFDDWRDWSRDWLVREIARNAVRPNHPWFSHVGYCLSIGDLHKHWRAMDACMVQLTMSEAPSELAAALTWLAERFFDHFAEVRAPASATALERIYDRIFLPTFRALVRASDGGIRACNARVKDTIAGLRGNGPYRT